ncbi:hypothetical protein QTP70_022393, partial [Hemibagrus guttatus]
DLSVIDSNGVCDIFLTGFLSIEPLIYGEEVTVAWLSPSGVDH